MKKKKPKTYETRKQLMKKSSMLAQELKELKQTNAELEVMHKNDIRSLATVTRQIKSLTVKIKKLELKAEIAKVGIISKHLIKLGL